MLHPGSCKKGMEEPGLNLGLSPKSHVLFSGDRKDLCVRNHLQTLKDSWWPREYVSDIPGGQFSTWEWNREGRQT